MFFWESFFKATKNKLQRNSTGWAVSVGRERNCWPFGSRPCVRIGPVCVAVDCQEGNPRSTSGHVSSIGLEITAATSWYEVILQIQSISNNVFVHSWNRYVIDSNCHLKPEVGMDNILYAYIPNNLYSSNWDKSLYSPSICQTPTYHQSNPLNNPGPVSLPIS